MAANAAKLIGLFSLVAAALLAFVGLAALDRGGVFFLVYGASALVTGVFMFCISAIVENTARSAAAQERLAEKMGK
ncbi:hypothetical protein [Brucella pituitosa]|uniref:hypothetical protein n=1 Tax=Brucella pituitosa TaxID=571256 RepID=UPI003F4A96A4